MKTKTTKIVSSVVPTEAENVQGIGILEGVIKTFTRIAGNHDAESFRKQSVAFRSLMESVGVQIAKNGTYVIPTVMNAYIDLSISTKMAGYRSTRQALKASLVACHYLTSNGTNATSYLAKAAKGSTHMDALLDSDWSDIKKSCNKARVVALAKKTAKANAPDNGLAETTGEKTNKTQDMGKLAESLIAKYTPAQIKVLITHLTKAVL